MRKVSIHAAKIHLSRLIEEALAGEEIVIERGNVPAVRLVPVESAASRRAFGCMKGEITVDPSFFEPLADAETW